MCRHLRRRAWIVRKTLSDRRVPTSRTVSSAAVRAPLASCADPHATAASRHRLCLRLHHCPRHHRPAHRRSTTSWPSTCATLAPSRARPTRALGCTKRLARRGAAQRMAGPGRSIWKQQPDHRGFNDGGTAFPCAATRCTCSVRAMSRASWDEASPSAPHTGTPVHGARAHRQHVPDAASGCCGRQACRTLDGDCRPPSAPPVCHHPPHPRALRRCRHRRHRRRLQWTAAARPTTWSTSEP